MYKTIITVSSLLVLLTITAFGLNLGDKRDFVVIEGVEIIDGNRAEAMYYYRNNWAKLRERAVKKGMIKSFELVETDKGGKGPDIYLITRFANKKQFEKVEENFRQLIDTAGGLKLLNDKKPGEFRRSMFGGSGRSE